MTECCFMKKLRIALITILCLLTALSCVFTASAGTIKYYIKPLGMSIRIPDNMSVKTKDNFSDLKDSIYLEAMNADKSLSITISMISDDKTKAAGSFAEMPSSAIRKYKENIESDGFTSGADCSYGGVPFLDFSRKANNEEGVETYVTQSITIVNGMSISVISQSPGDPFTSDEIGLIGSCLESIRFDNVGTGEKKVTFWGVVLWILLVIIVLSVAFIIFSFYMGKRNTKRKKEQREERRKKADYDVLRRADISHKQQEQAQKLGGYKTSGDYFDNGFDSTQPEKPAETPATPVAPTKTEIAVKNTKTTVTHMGYFFKNLKKEINKSSQKKASKKGKKQVRDYDIFSDR